MNGFTWFTSLLDKNITKNSLRESQVQDDKLENFAGKPALWTGDKPIPIPGSPPSSEQTSQQSESDAISGAPAPGPQSEALAPQPGASAPSPGASAPKPSSPGPKASAPTIAPVIAPAIAPSPKVASPAISPVADLAPSTCTR